MRGALAGRLRNAGPAALRIDRAEARHTVQAEDQAEAHRTVRAAALHNLAAEVDTGPVGG